MFAGSERGVEEGGCAAGWLSLPTPENAVRFSSKSEARIMSFRRIIMRASVRARERERSQPAHVNQCPLRPAADLIIR